MFRDNPSQDHPKTLTNEGSTEIANKFSFFCDCFNMSNVKANEFVNFEIETHQSLIDSLLCIVKEAQTSNGERFTAEYIKYIFKTHPLFNVDDPILKEYYYTIHQNIANIDRFDGKKPKTALPQIMSELLLIQQALTNNYLENIVKDISQCVRCKHKLPKHKFELDYYSRLLVSHYYFNGYSRKQISNIVNNVLTKDVDTSGDNIGVDFPVPKELYDRLVTHNRKNLPFDKQLFDDLENFSSNRTMNQQVEGFLYLSKYEKSQFTFYYKLEGIYLKTEDDMIDGMRLLSVRMFNKENKDAIEEAFFPEKLKAFLDDHTALLEYKVYAYSQSEASEIALNELRRKVGRLSMYINKKLNLETYEYIGKLRSGKIQLYNYYERVQIYGWDIDTFNHRSANKLKIEFRTYIDNLETILVDALNESDKNRTLHTYSKFIEQVINNIDHKINNSTEFRIPSKTLSIAYILLLGEKEYFESEIRRWCYNILINAEHTNIRLKDTKENIEKIFDSRKLPSLSKLYRLIDNQHALYRMKSAYKYKNQESGSNAFHYYVRFIQMLIKYRNIQEHSNIVDENIKRRLKLSASILLSRVIQTISREMNNSSNSTLTVNEIVSKLINDGKVKADTLKITTL